MRYAGASRRKKMNSQITHHRVDTTLRRADKEMSKAELRRELAEAVRNTAVMPVDGTDATPGTRASSDRRTRVK